MDEFKKEELPVADVSRVAENAPYAPFAGSSASGAFSALRTLEWINHRDGTYRGRPYKSDAELDTLAEKVVDLLRGTALPIWQAKEVCKRATKLLDWEQLKGSDSNG